MLPVYKLIIGNIVGIIITVLVALFHTYIYPKKPLSFISLITLISLLPLISLLQTGTYESGDMSINVYKSMAFYDSLKEGIFSPQWAKDLNATYGYPLFSFTYPLPYYLISLFHFLGFSFLASIKLLIAFCYMLSGYFMYLFTKQHMNEKASFVSALFYLFAPYHLVVMHYRVSVGEIVSFALVPLCMLAINKLLSKQSILWFVITILSLSLQLLANQAISLFAFPLFILYTASLNRTKSGAALHLMSLITSLLLTCFYWFPVIMTSKWTHQALYSQTLGFVPIFDLFFTPWRYGLLFQGPTGQLGFIIGYIHILVIALSFLYIKQKRFNKHERVIVISLVVTSFIFALLMTEFSKPLWYTVPFLRNFQFTYRLLLFEALFTSLLAGLVVTKIKRANIINFIICLAIGSTILNWGNRRTIPEITDQTLRDNLSYSTYQGEGFQPAAPKWTDPGSPWQKSPPKHHLEIISGIGEIKKLERTTHYHSYLVSLSHNSLLRENTLFFPDWKIRVNSKEVTSNYVNKKYPGIITFSIPKGIYFVEVVYESNVYRKIGESISIATLFSLSVYLIYLLYKPQIPKKKAPRNSRGELIL